MKYYIARHTSSLWKRNFNFSSSSHLLSLLLLFCWILQCMIAARVSLHSWLTLSMASRIWPVSFGNKAMRSLLTLDTRALVFLATWERWYQNDFINSLLYFILANWAPALPGKNLVSLRDSSGHFCKARFFSSDLFRFWSLGYPGVWGSGWRGHKCVKNLPRIGGEVCAKFGGDWSGSLHVKRGHRYKQSLLYRERDNIMVIFSSKYFYGQIKWPFDYQNHFLSATLMVLSFHIHYRYYPHSFPSQTINIDLNLTARTSVLSKSLFLV